MKAHITCSSCGTINDTNVSFCTQCGSPIGIAATTDPFQTVVAEGFFYRQVSQHVRNPIVVLGIWLLNGLFFLLGTCLIVKFISIEPFADFSLEKWLGFLGVTAYSAFSGIISIKTFLNYLKNRKQKPLS
jgi:undecaprenyl pyrophosphate phosphatase UppP